MMSDEMYFMHDNIKPKEIEQTIEGQQLTVQAKPELKSSGPSFVIFEKYTPENLASKGSAKDSSGNSFDMDKLPLKAKQKICDVLNSVFKEDFKQKSAKIPGMEMFDDGKHMGMRRTAESIKNPEQEVNNILSRAQSFTKESPKKNVDLSPTDQLKPENPDARKGLSR